MCRDSSNDMHSSERHVHLDMVADLVAAKASASRHVLQNGAASHHGHWQKRASQAAWDSARHRMHALRTAAACLMEQGADAPPKGSAQAIGTGSPTLLYYSYYSVTVTGRVSLIHTSGRITFTFTLLSCSFRNHSLTRCSAALSVPRCRSRAGRAIRTALRPGGIAPAAVPSWAQARSPCWRDR